MIALIITPSDTPYVRRLQDAFKGHVVKATTDPIIYRTKLGQLVDKYDLHSVVVTCEETLEVLLKAIPDFRHPVDKRGNPKKLSIENYAGSFFRLSKDSLKCKKDIDVLILPPLSRLVTTPEGPYLFKRWVSKITNPTVWFPQTEFSWELWTPEKSDRLLDIFSKAKLLAVDIETYVGDPDRRIRCVGYCALFPDGTTHSVVVPFKSLDAWNFVRQLNDSKPAKVFQNGMYDNAYFLRWNVPVRNWFYDTLHQFHSYLSELPKRLDFITAFSVRYVRYWKDDSAGSEHDLFEYNGRDCWATMMSCLALLSVPEWARKNYLEEFPLVFPCLTMELDGIAVNEKKFYEARAGVEATLEQHKAKLDRWLGPDFNPGSHVQVKNLLRALGIKNPESSDDAALTAYKAESPLAEHVLDEVTAVRKANKLLSNYFVWDKFWQGRLHYKLNPAGTDTGRLASSESSFWCGYQIQNIPRGPQVKSYLEADVGYDGIAEVDYSQSEARCVAYLSGCMNLINLVESEYDYHSYNASKFFGVKYEEVTKDIRDLSKRTNHGANYNMGAVVMLQTMGPKNVLKAQKLLGLPAQWSLIQVCQFLLDAYARTYPEVKKDWYQHIIRTVTITNKLIVLGRTRYTFLDPSKSKPALNSLVAHGPQSLSVAIINKALYPLWRRTVYGDLRNRVRLKAQIHDSVLFTYIGQDTPPLVREAMINPQIIADIHGVERTMKIPVDLSIGKAPPSRFWSQLK